jgi:hypothetical protein
VKNGGKVYKMAGKCTKWREMYKLAGNVQNGGKCTKWQEIKKLAAKCTQFREMYMAGRRMARKKAGQ